MYLRRGRLRVVRAVLRRDASGLQSGAEKQPFDLAPNLPLTALGRCAECKDEAASAANQRHESEKALQSYLFTIFLLKLVTDVDGTNQARRDKLFCFLISV